MKATGVVRRIDDLGRVVIPKEIRRTMRIREGDPTTATFRVSETRRRLRSKLRLTPIDRFCLAIHSVAERAKSR